MVQQKKMKHTGGSLFYIMALIYMSLLILFGYQTGVFVNWLFPSDQVLFKILTVVCFDGMSFFWAVVDLFYRFATKATRDLVRWGWGVSFLLSLVASILYLVISSMFRFSLIVPPSWVDVGYGIVIFAIVFQIVMVTFFLYIEWVVRHPYQDEYLGWTQEEASQITAAIGERSVVITAQQAAALPEPKKKRRTRVTELAESTTPGA